MYIFSGVTNNEKADPPPPLPSLPPPPHPNNRYIWDVAPPPRPLEIAWDHHSTCPAARLTFVTLFSSFVSFSFVVFCPFLTRFFYLFRLLQRDALSRVPIHSLVNHSFFPFSSESTLPPPLLPVVFFFSFFLERLSDRKPPLPRRSTDPLARPPRQTCTGFSMKWQVNRHLWLSLDGKVSIRSGKTTNKIAP